MKEALCDVCRQEPAVTRRRQDMPTTLRPGETALVSFRLCADCRDAQPEAVAAFEAWLRTQVPVLIGDGRRTNIHTGEHYKAWPGRSRFFLDASEAPLADIFGEGT